MRLLAAIAAVVAAVILLGCESGRSSCAELAHAQRWRQAVPVCTEAWARGSHPDDGVRLAAALLGTERYAELGPLGERLRGTARAADGAYYAGLAALRADDPQRAGHLFDEAMRGHRARGAWRELAYDGHQLIGTLIGQGLYHAAEDVEVAAADAARRAGDPLMLGYLAMTRADLEVRLGDVRAAEHALDDALDLLRGRAHEERWIRFKLGIVQLEASHWALAEAHFAWVLEHADPGDPDGRTLIDSTRLNLAWLASRDGRLAEAERQLAAIDVAGASTITAISLALGTSRIAAARGDLPRAEARLAAAEQLPLREEWTWVIPAARGRVAVRRGDTAGAEAALYRAVRAIERQREGGAGNDPVYLDAHSAPYFDLFALYARAGRWDLALAQLVSLEAGDLLDAGNSEDALRWDGVGGPGRRGPARTAPLATELIARIAALRASSLGADLVVALIAGDQLWRIELHGGALNGHAVAAATTARGLIDAVVTNPGDPAATTALGELLVPADPTRRPLYVALVGELGAVPLAALRHHGQLVIARRPLLRMVALIPAPPADTATGPALVLADPQGNLPAARLEAAQVAAALGATARVGGDATTRGLLDHQARVVHVASHAGVDDRGAYLALDRRVYADELARTSWGGTGLVVLASCGSAAARDSQGRGSLGSAFVHGGARAVLATQWSVHDDTTRQLLVAFYQAGGASDPAGALATAQAANAGVLDSRQWAAFTILTAPPPMR